MLTSGPGNPEGPCGVPLLRPLARTRSKRLQAHVLQLDALISLRPPAPVGQKGILYENNILKTLTNTDKFDGDLGYAMFSPGARGGPGRWGERSLLEEGLCTPPGQPALEIPKAGGLKKTEGKNKTID